MTETDKIKEAKDRLGRSLCLSIEHFRNCQDRLGLEMLMLAMEDLESLMDTYKYLDRQEAVDFDRLIPALQELYSCMRNRDITAMTDILEYTLYPLLEGEW